MPGKDIVLIPVWRRPELLKLALARLELADLADEHEFIFRLDRGHDPENMDVIAKFRLPTYSITFDAHADPGDAHNTLEGYRQARRLAGETGASLVYLVQEDLLVARDFFRFHRTAHALWRPFCVSSLAIAKWFRGRRLPDDRRAVCLHDRFHPYGVSFTPESLEEFLPHATMAYYRDQKGYVERIFPDSRIGWGRGEQDWLIDNIMNEAMLRCAVPFSPRAIHAGWYSDRRTGVWTPSGTVDERATQVAEVLADPARIANITDYPDIRPVPLDVAAAESLTLSRPG